MSISNVVISPELISKTIEENNFIPDNAKGHMTTNEFESTYGLEALKSFNKGKELLEFLFGIQSQNKKSLTYSLECNEKIIGFFCKLRVGSATTKTLNYSTGSWKNLRRTIDEDEAIEIAYSIRNSLIAVFEKVTDITNAVDIRALLESESLPTNQGWLRRYLAILYPDKFMPMLNSDWTNRIFSPLGLMPTNDWFENAKIFSEKAKEFNVDAFSFYHVIFKCATDQIRQELLELNIDPDQLADPANLLVTTKSAYEGIKRWIKSEELQARFEDYLSKRYSWETKIQSLSISENAVENTIRANKNHVKEYVDKLKKAGNIIFRGAPGTGKSYLAKQIAAYIISGGIHTDYNSLSYEEKKQVEFVQFHPSYDYSDFVEGLRPTKEGSSIGFELKDGIFKEFVTRARENFEKSKKTQSDIEKEISIDKKISDFLETSLENQEFETLHGNKFTISSYDDQQIKIYVPNNEITHTLTIKVDDIKMLLASEQEFKTIREIRRFFNKKHATQEHSYVYILYKNILESDSDFVETLTVEIKEKPFVFIIDEINRGEISKIFGELFYSIEPSKRGRDGEIATQYANLHDDSEEKFYIPRNVYIIGTMNDIDRSVDSFDFAMRRRFKFVEITAKESQKMLDTGITDDILREETKERMDRLNAAIDTVSELNSNYHIGASYFMNIKEKKSFKELWEDSLQPLLQEYIVGTYTETDTMQKFEIAYFGEKTVKLTAENANDGVEDESDETNRQ